MHEAKVDVLDIVLAKLDEQPTADVQPVDKVLNVINGMITTEHSERNCVIEEVYQKVAELKGYGDEHDTD